MINKFFRNIAIICFLILTSSSIAAPPIQKLSTPSSLNNSAIPSNNHLLPISVLNAPADATSVSYYRSLGINTFVGNRSGTGFDGALLDELRAHGMRGILNYNDTVSSHPALMAWILAFTPDMTGDSTASLQFKYETLKTSDTIHPTFVAIENGFYSDAQFNYIPEALAGNPNYYTGYTSTTDIIGVLTYPLNQWGKSEWLYLPGASLENLIANYTQGNKPAWAILEASDQDLTSASVDSRGPTPEELRFEAWDSILHGANGLGYCTQAFNPDRWKNLEPTIEEELKRTNDEIFAMQKIFISSPRLDSTATEANGRPFHFLACRYRARGYLVVDNADMTRTTETINFFFLQNLASVELVGEKRYIPVTANSFSDVLPPLAVHVYEINFLPPSLTRKDYHVSKTGSNGNGLSWNQAWNELDQINWNAVQPGDTIYIDGGDTSVTYTTLLQSQKGGTSSTLPITIRRSEEPGHNGVVNIEAQIKIWHPFITLEGGIPDKFNIFPTDTMCGVFIGYWDNDASGSELRNVSLRGTYLTVSGISLGVYSPDCVIHGCQFERSPGEDMLAVMTPGNITVEECHFYGLEGSGSDESHRDAISVYPGTEIGSVFTLRNNFFENNKTDNFGVFPTEGAILGGFEIWGNTFRFCNTAIHFDDRVAGAEFINVYNNKFQDIRVAVHNNSAVEIDSTYNTITEGEFPTPSPFPTMTPTETPTPETPTETPTPMPANFTPSPTPTPTRTPNPNLLPTAEAGPNQEVDEGTLLSLNGSESTSPNLLPLTYDWTQTSGIQFPLVETSDSKVDFAVPYVTTTTLATFELDVSDGIHCSTDSLQVKIRAKLEKPPGLIAEYSMDNIFNDWIIDSSGNNNNGLVHSAQLTSDGKFWNSLYFDGIDNKVVVPTNPTLDPKEGLTIEAWVCPTAITNQWMTVVERKRSLDTSYGLFANSPDNEKPASIIYLNTNRILLSNIKIPIYEWTYLASTYDGTVHCLYINGSVVSYQLVQGTLDTWPGDIILGCNEYDDRQFQGFLDNIRIYNRALTMEEIVADMKRHAGNMAAKNSSEWMLYR